MVSERRSYAAAAVSAVAGVNQKTQATTSVTQSPFIRFLSRVVPKSVPQRNSINRALLLQSQAAEKINTTQSRNNKVDARSPIRSASATIPERNLILEQISVADPQRKAIQVCPSSISIALPQRREGAPSIPIARSPISAIFIVVPQWNQFRQRKYHPKDLEKSDLKKMEQSSDSATVASSARAKSKENEIEKKDVHMESSQCSCVESSSGVLGSAIELKLSINSEFFDDYSSAYSELQSDVFGESSDLDFSDYSPSMWRLLLSELHVEHASAIEIPNGIGGSSSSNVEAFANAMVRFRGGCRFDNGRPNEGPMHIITSLENEIVYPKKYNLNPEVKTLLKRNVGVCCAGLTENRKHLENQSQASLGSLKIGDSLGLTETGGDQSPNVVSDDDAIISVVSKFRDLHIQSTETAQHGLNADFLQIPECMVEAVCTYIEQDRPFLGMVDFLVVHNDVITNYEALKESQIRHDFTFESETDTVVIPKLAKFVIDKANEEGDEGVTFSQVVLEVMRHLEGAYALIFKSQHYPNELIACKRGSPLVLGVKDFEEEAAIGASFSDPKFPSSNGQPKELFLSSGANALVEHTKKALVIEDNGRVDDSTTIQESKKSDETKEATCNSKRKLPEKMSKKNGCIRRSTILGGLNEKLGFAVADHGSSNFHHQLKMKMVSTFPWLLHQCSWHSSQHH